MKKIRDGLWLWGQTAGTHTIFPENIFNMPGVSRMTPLEGCVYFDISNICRTVMDGKPVPPYDQEMLPLEKLNKVVWSVVGSCDSELYKNGGNDIDEILRLSNKYENIVGGILDDILNETRIDIYTPDIIKQYADKLHNNGKRRLDLWTVIYEHELLKKYVPYLESCDVFSFWTWHGGQHLPQLEENIYKLKELYPNKPVCVGVYMWDYGARKPLADEIMQHQLDVVYKLMKNKIIEGAIFCSNAIADIGIKAVDITKKWIEEHGYEEI